MDTREVITSQYYASLDMLREAISRCPPSLWNSAEYTNRFWHIAYHILFYTHLYLQDSEDQFVLWKRHRKHYQLLGAPASSPEKSGDTRDPYTKEEILEYFDFCRAQVGKRVPFLDPDAESGFNWLPFRKLELQLYNIRHIQHHTGALIDRLRTVEDIGVTWVGSSSADHTPGN